MVHNKYSEIKTALLEAIVRGKCPIGSQLPTEHELAETYKVSRGTVRRAINELAEDRIVNRRVGIGTFVVRKPVKDRPILSFTSKILHLGKTPTIKVISSEAVLISEADPWVRKEFHQMTGTRPFLYRLERIRFADDLPVSWQISYLLMNNLAPDFFDDAFTGSLFERFRKYGHLVSWTDEVIQARLATLEEIARLEMHALPVEQQIVWHRKRITYNQANLPLEAVVSYDRCDLLPAYHYRIQEEYLPDREG